MWSMQSSGSVEPPYRVLVSELQHVVLIRDGRITRVLEPGRHRLRRSRDRLWVETATPQALVIPSQEILTSDGASVRVTVTSLVTVASPLVAVRAGDWRSRWYLDVQQALRAAVTAAPLDELVADRTGLDGRLRAALDPAASQLGLVLTGLALRDLVVLGEPRRQMAEVVAARLAGQASLERARGETAALRSLANAAALIKDNPALYKLRLLQELSASSGNTFILDTDPPVG